MEINFATDADGFLSQECPSCEQRFKVVFGEGSEGPVSYCPYCGHNGQNCWFTQAQVDYMQSVAVNVVLGPELKKLERQLKGTSNLSEPPPAPTETDDLLDILHLPCCNETVKVTRYERHFCIICGTGIDMTISDALTPVIPPAAGTAPPASRPPGPTERGVIVRPVLRNGCGA